MANRSKSMTKRERFSDQGTIMVLKYHKLDSESGEL
jgi:hypothetical protein